LKLGIHGGGVGCSVQEGDDELGILSPNLLLDLFPKIIGVLNMSMLFISDRLPLVRSVEGGANFFPVHMVKLHVNQYEGKQFEERISTKNDLIIVVILLYLLELPSDLLVLHNLLVAQRFDKEVHQVLVDLRAVHAKVWQQI